MGIIIMNTHTVFIAVQIVTLLIYLVNHEYCCESKKQNYWNQWLSSDCMSQGGCSGISGFETSRSRDARAWGLRARCTLGSPFSTRPSWCDQEVSAALVKIIKISRLRLLWRLQTDNSKRVGLDLSLFCVQVGQIGLIRKNGGRKEDGEWSAMLPMPENFTWKLRYRPDYKKQHISVHKYWYIGLKLRSWGVIRHYIV